MKASITQALKIGTLTAAVALAAGCATTASEDTMAAIEEARAAAAAAQSTADQALSTARSAESTADQAMDASQDAQDCCAANSRKMERMFDRSMQK